MGGKASKGLDEAQQRRLLQIQTIQHGLSRSNKSVHFENLVFEGSGNRAISYFGVIKVLEELGLLPSFRRYAGVGAGAAWALLLSIGLTPAEIADLQLDKELSYHAKYIHMSSIMPNLAQKFGWSPLGRAVKIARKILEQKTGKQEVTFREIYDQFGKELCIVATNLTTGSLEYFHPKTTPDIPVVDALIMSSTPPGIMKPRYIMRAGKKHYFVDGGVLCNYPVYCFDGWYLSMKKEDSFLSRLGSASVDPPFKGYNDRTLGLMLVTPGEGDFGEQEFLRRLQYEPLVRPHTKLSRAKGEAAQSETARVVGDNQVAHAGQRLLEHLRLANISGEDTLNMEKFQRALGQGSSPEDIRLLFGQSPEQLTELFNQLENSREGKVTFEEFVEVAQQQGIALRKDGGGATVRDIKTAPDMLMAVMSAIEGKSKQVYLKEIDIMRTVGINADYLSAVDSLEFQDKNFLVVQGEAACLAFLLEYIQNFATQEQLPIPQIYSALPNRFSRQGSIIDPDEMQDYSVPQNLYPTLPPSYASAMGDSDHLRDAIETNWPSPGTGLYPGIDSYAEEKRPPSFTPANFTANFAAGSSTTPDTWGLPVAPVPGPSPCDACGRRAENLQQPQVPMVNSVPVQSPTVIQNGHQHVLQHQYVPQQVPLTGNPQRSIYPGLQLSQPNSANNSPVAVHVPRGPVQTHNVVIAKSPNVQRRQVIQISNSQPTSGMPLASAHASNPNLQGRQIIQVGHSQPNHHLPMGSPITQRPFAAPTQGVIMIGGGPGGRHQVGVPVPGHAQQKRHQRQLKVHTGNGRSHFITLG